MRDDDFKTKIVLVAVKRSEWIQDCTGGSTDMI